MKTPMTKLDPARTTRHRNHRTGRDEIWETVSADGRWAYERQEESTTPWVVDDLHAGDESELEWFGTLAAARRWTAQQPAPKPVPAVAGT